MKEIVCKTCKIQILNLCGHGIYRGMSFGDLFCGDKKCQNNYRSNSYESKFYLSCKFCKTENKIYQFGGDIPLNDLIKNINSSECMCSYYCKEYYIHGERGCKIKLIGK